MKKRIVSLFMACALTSALAAGCGGNSNQSESNSDDSRPKEEESGDVVNLDMWVFGGLGAEPVVFQELAEKYNESQDKIHVTVTAQDWGSRQEKIVTAFQAGDDTAPDIYALGPCIEDYGVKMGVISPIEEVLPEIAEQVRELMLPEVVEGVASKDGTLWTIPSWVDLSPYMMYSIDALKAIGLDENNLPETWSEFKEAAVKFKEAGYTGYSIPMSMDNYPDVNNEFNYWNWQLGGAPMDAEGKVMTMNDEHAITTVEFLN